MISAGAVAADGIERKSGEKRSATANPPATTNAVNPERPPWATPAALSTYVVVVEVPSIAPHVVAIESAMKACLILAILPFSSTMFALVQTPTRVPTVSNISMKRNVNTTTSISRVKILSHSNWQKIGAIESGVDNTPLNSVTPIGIPIIIVMRIPRRIAPGTLRANRKPVMNKPIRARRAGPEVILPRVTIVALSATTTPAL